MSLEICPVAYSGESYDRAVIVDTVTERMLPLPLFASEHEADAFLSFAQDLDVGDVRALGADGLERIHTAWLAARSVEEHDPCGA